MSFINFISAFFSKMLLIMDLLTMIPASPKYPTIIFCNIYAKLASTWHNTCKIIKEITTLTKIDFSWEIRMFITESGFHMHQPIIALFDQVC